VVCVTDRTGDPLHHPHQRLRAPNSSADDLTRPVTGCHIELSLVINQSINIRLLRHDKMQAYNSKQKGNTVSKKKACLDDKPWTAAAWDRQTDGSRYRLMAPYGGGGT